MNDETTLLIFGFGAIVFPIFYIVSRFLRGKAHLCTTINAALVGYIPFIGFSTIAFANQSGKVQTPYANYRTEDIHAMIGSVCLFTITMLISYGQSRPISKCNSLFVRQPAYSTRQAATVSILALLLGVACLMPRFGLSIPLLSELLIRSMSAIVIFAALFAFASWWKDRRNIRAFWLFITIFPICIVLAVLVGTGRRAMLGVVLSVGVYAYWQNYQHLNRLRIIYLGGIFLSIAFLFMTGYNQVRHFSRNSEGGKDRTASNAISALAEMPVKISRIDITSDQIVSDIGQNATNCSLYSIALSRTLKYNDKTSALNYPSYFHTIVFIAANPVPRRFWSTKPLALGYLLPVRYYGASFVNWGPGLAGHFYHEGGMFMALIYGILLGFILKKIDSALLTTPNSLFSIAFVSSILPQLVCFVRGDIAIIFLNLIFSLVTFVVLKYSCLIIYGYSNRMPHYNALQE